MSLVGHYKLNGDATDSSGSGYHGTVSGATLATDKNGIANNCYSFDGVDDYINLNRNLLDYPENFSLSLWLYNDVSGTESYVRAVSCGAGGSGAYGFSIVCQNSIQTVNYYINFRTTDDTLKQISFTISDSTWTQLTLVKNDSLIQLYVNGEYFNQIALTQSEYRRSVPSYLGGNETSASFKGLIDDVRIYDCPLSLKEIKELSLGKYAHYKFNGNAKDCSGSDLHGTAGADVSYNTTTPLIGSSSADITGVSTSIITLPFGNGLVMSNYNFSVSLWVNCEDASTTEIFLSSSPVASHWFYFGKISGKWGMAIRGSNLSAGIIDVVTSKKTHIGIVCDKTNCYMYVDGVLNQTKAVSSVVLARNLWLGALQINATYGYYWNGLIDDVQFFSTALTQQDFIDIMQTSASMTKNGDIIVNEINEVGVSSGLLGYWNFKEGSGTSFYNKINRNTYTGVVDLAWATWLDPQGISTSKLSTTNNMVYVPVVANTDFITGDLTYSFSFRRTSQKDTADYLVDRRAINIYIDSGTEITCRVIYGAAGESVVATTSGAGITNNVWFYVAVSIHQDVGGGGYINIYVNGVLLGTADLASYIANATYASTAHLRWGAEPWATPTMTSAEFRDTKIFNRILTEDEILQESKLTYLNANKQIQAKSFSECSITDGLVGWYPLRKNANDYSGYNRHGTVNGGAVVSTNRFSESGSYSFDGVDDYINLFDLNLVPNDFSLSVWIYNDISGGEAGTRFVHGGFTGGAGGFGFGLLKTNASDTAVVLNFRDTNNTVRSVTFSCLADEWTHVSFVKSGLDASLYRNGIYISNLNSPLVVTTFQRSVTICLGGIADINSLKGKIDDVRIYDRALTEKEIALLYEYGKTKITNDGIVYIKEIKETI